MKPVSKKTIAVICVVALIGFGAWLYLWLLTNEYTRSDKEKSNSIEVLRKDWAKATNDNLLYRDLFEKLQDTITGLKVEKGQVEIELNRKTEELRQANNRYKSSRQLKDTAKALTICDSIVYTYLPGYFEVDSSLYSIGDSLQEFQGKWVAGLADTVLTISDKFRNTIKTQIDEKTEEKKQDKKEARKQKGGLIKAGIFGAAVGVLLTLILGG